MRSYRGSEVPNDYLLPYEEINTVLLLTSTLISALIAFLLVLYLICSVSFSSLIVVHLLLCSLFSSVFRQFLDQITNLTRKWCYRF